MSRAEQPPELLAGSVSMCNKQNYLARAKGLGFSRVALGGAPHLVGARFSSVRFRWDPSNRLRVSSHACPCCCCLSDSLFVCTVAPSIVVGFNGTFNSSVVLALTTFVSIPPNPASTASDIRIQKRPSNASWPPCLGLSACHRCHPNSPDDCLSLISGR